MKKHSSEVFENDSICNYDFSFKNKNTNHKKGKYFLYSWIIKNNKFIDTTPPQQKKQFPDLEASMNPDKLK